MERAGGEDMKSVKQKLQQSQEKNATLQKDVELGKSELKRANEKLRQAKDDKYK